MKISVGWYYVEELDSNTLVYSDIRFGQFGFTDDAPYLWKYELTITTAGKIEAKRQHFSPKNINYPEALGEIWDRIGGN